ncbi:hypothetical protein ABBQ32_005766 [Trebouxia sp. C0010 RCD-2024]
MSSNNLDAATLEQGSKRRSFPGNKDVAKSPGESVAMTASTSQVSQAPTFGAKQGSWYSTVVKREWPLIGLLSTGTAMVVLNQVIADQDIADSSVHVLAWVKYGAIYLGACLAARGSPANAHHSKEQNTLMAIIGLLDVCAYAANCLGVTFCGAAVAALTLAGTQQVITGAMSYLLLGRRLNPRQVSGVAIVCLGLALQGLAPEPALAAGLTTAPTPAPSGGSLVKLVGVACMLLSSAAYSFLGVSYDLLVRSEGPTPTHSEVMFCTAKIALPPPTGV